jgi:uncharacterized protein YdhG (YjbR/CyaY superfamily)
MAERKSAAKPGKPAQRFTAEERAAMRERSREAKGEGEGEAAVLAKIAEMPEPDRANAQRIHAIVTAAAPGLTPRLWYGMPAYARDGKVICFFQNASKFKARYSTLGFSDKATLDDGAMWPTSYAFVALTAEAEAQIAALVKKAVG